MDVTPSPTRCFSFLLGLTLLIAGCGGGGGSSDPTPTSPPTNNPDSQPSLSVYQLERSEAAGICENMWVRVSFGRDEDGNGELGDSEISETEEACSSVSAPSLGVYFNNREQSPGDECPVGGQSVEYGPDTNENGELDTGEIEGDVVLCHRLEEVVAPEATFDIDEDQPLSAAMLPESTEGVSLEVVSEPGFGEVRLQEGSYHYTPDAEWSGSDTFTVRAESGSETANQAVTVNVAPIDDEPVMADPSYDLYRDSYIRRQLAGQDADGERLTYSLERGALFGDLSLTGGGIFEYQPGPGFAGQDSFTVRLNDGNGWTEPFTVQLQVTPTQTQPVLDLRAWLVDYNEVELSWTADYGDSTGYEIRRAPHELTVDNWQEATIVLTSTDLGQEGATEQMGFAGLEVNQDHYFGVRLSDDEGAATELSNIVWVKTFPPASLEVVGSAPAPVDVERKQQRQQTIEIRNFGSEEIEFTAQLSTQAGDVSSAQAPARYQPLKVSKGEQDPRKGTPVTQNTGGPDNYGYRWVDSNEPSGPDYNWIDIKESGTAIEGIYDDSVQGPFPIGFEFPFYEGSVDEFYLSSNGFISFSQPEHSGCCSGQPLPQNDSLNHLIALFWDDLDPADDQIFYHTMGDGRFVLQFEGVEPFGGGGSLTAQLILHSDGSIVLQYKELAGYLEDSDYYSVGIENGDGSDGLQVAFNTPYLEDELALRISSEPQWLSVAPETTTVPAGDSTPVTVDYRALVGTGTHKAQLRLHQPGLAQAALSLPLEMEVTADASAPERVTDLRLQHATHENLTLAWSAVADAGIATDSPVAGYEMRYSTSAIDSSNWNNAEVVSGMPLPAAPGQHQSVTITGLQSETDYYVAIKVFDGSGNTTTLSNVAAVGTLRPPAAALDTTAVSEELREGREAISSLVLSNTGGADLSYRATLMERPEAEAASSRAGGTVTAKPTGRPVKKLKSMPPADSYIKGEIIVRLKRRANAAALNALQQQYQATTIQRIPRLQMEVWKLSGAVDDFQVIQALNGLQEVLFAEPNYRVSLQGIPDDVDFDRLWGLHNLGVNGGLEDADIDALGAWDIVTGSRSVVVAVIDSGVDYNHSDLAANMWLNSDEVPDNGVDDDENGYVDDVYGYNFYAGNADPDDENGHGTHVAGTIGAVGNNGLGVVGVNHQVSLMAAPFLGPDGSGDTVGAIEAILYAVDNGADILNNSWGGGSYSEALLEAIEHANANDVLFVAAAGNWSEDNDIIPSYPANYEVPNVISVAATDWSDQLASFSNFGQTSVDLAAPGVGTLSTVPGDGYDTFSGTSMASPHVAGVAALLKAYKPALTSEELKTLLLDSTDSLGNLADRTLTGGRLNAHEAVLLSGPSWVALESAITGSVSAGEEATIDLEFDTFGLEAGDYTIDLQIETNDPSQPVIVVPVTLTVLPDSEAPATVDDLTVDEVTDTTAEVAFTAPGDDGMEGQASSYEVRYSDQPLTGTNWEQAQTLEGEPLPGQAGQTERFTISGLAPNADLWVAVRALDNMGQLSDLSNVVAFRTLNADLTVSPESLPSVTLASGAVETIDVQLENTGEADISASIDVGTQLNNFGAYTAQYFVSDDLAKGEVDTRVGPPVTADSGGPDDFGYRWIDSDEADGPTYQWEDISDTGNPIEGLYDDSVFGPIDIGFEFPFYGAPQNQLYLSSNGFVAFSEPLSSGCCAGQPIPRSDSINHIIAWLWYDLYPGAAQVHYQTLNQDKFILQFLGYGEFAGGGAVEAQLVLHRSGNIELRYRAFHNGMAKDAASVGIENEQGTAGLQVAFNTDYLKDEHVILFRSHWLTVSDGDLTLEPGETATVSLRVDADGLGAGDYQSQLRIRSNDSDQPELLMPIDLEVTE